MFIIIAKSFTNMNFESTADNIINKTISSGATDCDVILAKGWGKSISCRLIPSICEDVPVKN